MSKQQEGKTGQVTEELVPMDEVSVVHGNANVDGAQQNDRPDHEEVLEEEKDKGDEEDEEVDSAEYAQNGEEEEDSAEYAQNEKFEGLEEVEAPLEEIDVAACRRELHQADSGLPNFKDLLPQFQPPDWKEAIRLVRDTLNAKSP